eukprot:XP_015582136.1 uncharacterized protein LOC107262215 [Ricinus communis]
MNTELEALELSGTWILTTLPHSKKAIGNFEFLVTLVYVDDVLLTGTSLDAITFVKNFLHQKFTLKDLGFIKYFLVIEVARSTYSTFLSQRKYIMDILQDVGVTGAKPTSFPLLKNLKLETVDSPLLHDPNRYGRVVGTLLYATITRPDICYATHI